MVIVALSKKLPETLTSAAVKLQVGVCKIDVLSAWYEATATLCFANNDY